jgi:pimeloyl-ACP methyl ester carboxylesterase
MPHLTRDGVKLYYEEAGSGPPVVLIHGWCCDRTYLAPQAEHYRARHHVVSVDLRGHGGSDKPEQEYTIRGFADDVAWLCGELGITGPLVIGHSMGGDTALGMAAWHPALAAAIVMLDAPVLLPQELVSALLPQLIAAFRSPAYRDAARQFVAGQMFRPGDDPERKERILDGMSAAPQHVLASAFAAIGAFDSAGALQACKVPALFIGADPAAVGPAPHARTLPDPVDGTDRWLGSLPPARGARADQRDDRPIRRDQHRALTARSRHRPRPTAAAAPRCPRVRSPATPAADRSCR